MLVVPSPRRKYILFLFCSLFLTTSLTHCINGDLKSRITIGPSEKNTQEALVIDGNASMLTEQCTAFTLTRVNSSDFSNTIPVHLDRNPSVGPDDPTFYQDKDCTTPITSLSVPGDSSIIDFFVKAPTPQNVTLIASSDLSEVVPGKLEVQIKTPSPSLDQGVSY